jgi:hypothetical protein
MSATDPKTHAESPEWMAETLRLTAFIASPIPADQRWWQDLVGSSPENTITRQKEQIQQQEGPFENGRLALTTLINRIDWIFTISLDKETLGPFSKSIDTFTKLMDRWLPSCPPMSRLAFGAILLKPVQNRSTGYKWLIPFLPNLKIDPDGSTDLLYQINRSRGSGTDVPGLRINRLSKWSVRVHVLVQLTPAPTIVNENVGQQSPAAQLELDINTSPELKGTLPPEMVIAVYHELVDMGREIASKGDVP